MKRIFLLFICVGLLLSSPVTYAAEAKIVYINIKRVFTESKRGQKEKEAFTAKVNAKKKEVENINRLLPDHARIKKFINLHKEFDPDEAELTRTRKVRRDFMADKYQQLVDGLFSEDAQIDITASITYRDGTKGEIKSSLLINDV